MQLTDMYSATSPWQSTRLEKSEMVQVELGKFELANYPYQLHALLLFASK